ATAADPGVSARMTVMDGPERVASLPSVSRTAIDVVIVPPRIATSRASNVAAQAPPERAIGRATGVVSPPPAIVSVAEATPSVSPAVALTRAGQPRPDGTGPVPSGFVAMTPWSVTGAPTAGAG